MTVTVSSARPFKLGKRALLYPFIAASLVFICLNSEALTSAASRALLLCARSVIPSLLPFMAVSGFALRSGFAFYAGRAFGGISRKLFKVGGEGGVAFVIGLLSGYPIGAEFAAGLYRSGRCSKDEAERLIPFCNNAGPAFLISGVGAAMRGSLSDGIIIFFAQLLSAILCGVALRFTSNEVMSREAISPPPECAFGETFSASVESVASGLVKMCGYIVFFAVLCASLDILLSYFGIVLPAALSALLYGFLEVTNGCSFAAEIAGPAGCALTACIAGWSGLSVMAQTASLTAGTGLSLRRMLTGKLFQAAVAGLSAYLIASVWAMVQ